MKNKHKKSNRRLTPQQKHAKHQAIIRPVLKVSPHKYELFCVDCSKHIQWLSEKKYQRFLRSEH